MGMGHGCGLQMFFSTVEASIDARGRVLVPSSFRTALEGASKFYLFPSIDRGGYLEGGGQPLMDEYLAILKNMSPHDRDRRAFITSIFSKGAEVSMDQAGRANLPANLLSVAGIEKELVFVGAMDRFQIWNPERFAAYENEMSEHAAANQDALAQPFQQFRTGGQS